MIANTIGHGHQTFWPFFMVVNLRSGSSGLGVARQSRESSAQCRQASVSSPPPSSLRDTRSVPRSPAPGCSCFSRPTRSVLERTRHACGNVRTREERAPSQFPKLTRRAPRTSPCRCQKSKWSPSLTKRPFITGEGCRYVSPYRKFSASGLLSWKPSECGTFRGKHIAVTERIRERGLPVRRTWSPPSVETIRANDTVSRPVRERWPVGQRSQGPLLLCQSDSALPP